MVYFMEFFWTILYNSVAGFAAGAAESYTRVGAGADGVAKSSYWNRPPAEESFPAGETRLPSQRWQEDQRYVQASQSGRPI